MGFLRKFFRNAVHEEADLPSASSFEQLSEEELELHLGINRYGSFELTDAVRPSYDLQVIPSAGYRFDCYRDDATNHQVPVIMASVTKEHIFETFMNLIDPLGSVVDVVLESSHQREGNGHCDLYREHIDMPILQSILWEFEELLTNDGCTGIAVLNPGIPQEVQFDEHKLLIAYGKDLTAYEDALIDGELPRRDDIHFITEAEHVHSTSEEYITQFEELKTRLGIDEFRDGEVYS